MIILATHETCSGCSACASICPKQAIQMVADVAGFRYPQIDAATCVQCHACERVCPVLHPWEPEPETQATCYAARTQNAPLREASSSGGIFTELAQWTLAQGGVVFGCRWEKPDFVAIHAKAETVAELAAMRGSKYVQSDVRATFKEVKQALEAGRAVLWSGTPCQVAGLKHFLGKPYPRLLTVEIMCHGTPSPAVFEQYKRELSQGLKEQSITAIAFRKKNPTWRTGIFSCQFSNGEARGQACYYADPYVQLFLRDFILRSSCYGCQARGGRSQADFTIADFWGIEQVCPALDDDRGTSAVMVHTPSAQKVWQAIAASLETQCVTIAQLTHANPSYYVSVPRPVQREWVFKRLQRRTVAQVARRMIQGSIGQRSKKLAKRIIKHCLKRIGLR